MAHHQDDSVETLLLNLIRGTGINGLRGIRPKNGTSYVRCLLERKEIISYLNRIGQDYVTDSTNLQDEYTRNKIRLNLLPMMQEINPSVKESILNTAEHLDGASAIYKQGIDEGIKRCGQQRHLHRETDAGTGPRQHYCLKSYTRSALTLPKSETYTVRWKDSREKSSLRNIGAS